MYKAMQQLVWRKTIRTVCTVVNSHLSTWQTV